MHNHHDDFYHDQLSLGGKNDANFDDAQGELVRAILFPPPLDFAFYSDFLKSVRLVMILLLLDNLD